MRVVVKALEHSAEFESQAIEKDKENEGYQDLDFFEQQEIGSRVYVGNFQNTTPQFILNMIEYCLSEIREMLAENDLKNYVECVKEISERIGSAEYPISRVSILDEKRVLSELKSIHGGLLDRIGDLDQYQLNLAMRAQVHIDLLEEKFNEKHSCDEFLPPPIEDRSAYWEDVGSYGEKLIFDGSEIGRPLDISLCKQLKGLENFEYFPILGDGACWARSLWQAVLPQILDQPASFKDFVRRIENCNKEFSDPGFYQNNDLSDVIALLKKLRSLNNFDRQCVLNRTRPDICLQMFARKLISAIIKKEADNIVEVESYTSKLELPSTFGGAEEINRFVKYFNVSVAEVSLVYKSGQHIVQYNVYGKEPKQNDRELPGVMLFGINPVHYCILRKTN